jgi:hypothetical protein
MSARCHIKKVHLVGVGGQANNFLLSHFLVDRIVLYVVQSDKRDNRGNTT